MVTEDREDELQALATAQGWTFSIVDNDDLLTTLSFRFFTNGIAVVSGQGTTSWRWS